MEGAKGFAVMRFRLIFGAVFQFLCFILRFCGFSRTRGLRFLDYILCFDFAGYFTFGCDCGFFLGKNVAVFCLHSVRFCGFRPSLTPPSLSCARGDRKIDYSTFDSSRLDYFLKR